MERVKVTYAAWADRAAAWMHGAVMSAQSRRVLRAGGLPPAVERALGHIKGPSEPESTRWFDRIEAVRRAHLRSDGMIGYEDLGAGPRTGRSSADPGTNRIWVERRIADIARSSVPPHEGRLLFHIACSLDRPVVLEMGTCLGISAAYLAGGLSSGGLTGAAMTSLEGGEELAHRASASLRSLDLGFVDVRVGAFTDTLAAALESKPALVFLDGHHDPDAMGVYTEILLERLDRGALLVVDDIAWTRGMRRFWRALQNHSRLGASVDLGTVGIAAVA